MQQQYSSGIDPNIFLFLESLVVERGASQNTVEAYRRDLSDSAYFIQEHSHLPLSKANETDLRDYLTSLHQQDLSRATTARRLSALRQFFKYLLIDQIRADDPCHMLDSPQSARPLPKILSEEQVISLIDACQFLPTIEGVRMLALMELLYATGMRVSELVALPVSELQRHPEAITVTGKGRKQRLLPLTDAAREAVEAYLAIRQSFLTKSKNKTAKSTPSPFLFPSHGKSGHLTRQRFGQLLKELAHLAHIPAEQVSPHVLRHAFATHLLAHGADLRSLQQMLGHADIATTQIYTHVQTQKLIDTVKNYHPLGQSSQKSALCSPLRQGGV